MNTVAFIGAGRMASAMVTGLLREQVYAPDAIVCTCGQDPTGPELAARTGIRYVKTAAEAVADSDTIVLACKPQQFSSLEPVLTDLTEKRLILSILAGTPLSRLCGTFSKARNVVRAMPNTPGQIGQGVSAYASSQSLSDADTISVQNILGSLGTVVSLPESQIDAVTAVSGSGPAYVFEFTAALRQAAEKAGLNPEIANTLARETVIGSALLMRESGTDPVDLRIAVTSPGGTTQAALESFEADGFRAMMEHAVEAALHRSQELSKA